MAREDYDWSTAEAVCNDAKRGTWEVRAKRYGRPQHEWWVVSESTEMTEDEAAAWLNNITGQD